jgi:GDP-L-fucose synthase
MINRDSKIFVAGHNGMVGSAIKNKLLDIGYNNILSVNKNKLNLLIQSDVNFFLKTHKPDFVFICAAKVGGINANNTLRADFIYENLQIQNNLIHYSHLHGVKKLIFLGSSCIYPKFAKQPIKEDYLLDGELEYTNEPYAIAKIAGIKMCENYFKQYSSNFYSVMPTNLYGENDNFNLNTSHVIPALINKVHCAKIEEKQEVEVWGTGKPLREFMHVNDLADACIFLMEYIDANQIYGNGISHLNVGTGKEISIEDLVKLLSNIIDYKFEIKFNTKMPDGTPRKLLDSSLINSLGWIHKIDLLSGLSMVYDFFKKNYLKN